MNLKQQFVMTKKEKILTVILVGILVAYGWYQVAYGTNESSYQFGKKWALDAWPCWKQSEHDQNAPSCEMGQDSCTGTWNNAVTVVDNQTACIHGFIHTWNKLCNHNIMSGSDIASVGIVADQVNTTAVKIVHTTQVLCPDFDTNEGLSSIHS